MPAPPPPLPPGRDVEIAGRGTGWVWDTGGSARPTVVLAHGWMSTAALTWFRCFPALRDEYRVVAMDLRGHGRGIRSAWPFRLEDCADDLAALIDQLGCGRVVAAGYSMGGPVVQLLRHRHPEAVDGLVLCATASSFPGPAAPAAAVAAFGLSLSLALSAVPSGVRQDGLKRLVRARPGHAGLAPWAAREAELGDPAAYLQAAVALNSYDADGWIGTLDVPTAAIITRRDTTVPPARQRAMAEAIPGATILEVDGPHRACVDAAREFVPALLQACRKVSSTGG